MLLLTDLTVQYSNKHLIEVNCGFQFPEETSQWDSTFFGQYYEKIKDKGFTDKEERKGVQIIFNNISVEPTKPVVSTSPVEDQVVFRDNIKGLAIIIGKGKISFHCVQNYAEWDIFVSSFIKPFYEIYEKLGLGNGKRQCNVVYLNRFECNHEIELSKYFTIISSMDSNFGKEVITNVQRLFSNKENLLIAKLNSQIVEEKQIVNLECGAVCINEDYINNTDWISQANKTHEPIKSFFESVVTNELKSEL